MARIEDFREFVLKKKKKKKKGWKLTAVRSQVAEARIELPEEV